MGKIKFIALAGVCLASLGSNAFAAELEARSGAEAADSTSGADTDDSNVIIVEARRRDENVQDVPAVINTVTSETVAALNIQKFEDVQSLVPGLQLSSEANGIAAKGQLRGVDYDPNGSINPTVEFYLNDAPVQATVVLQQMYDIGQIEVLRGPQGTLRGRASPSGSITVTSRKPDLEEFGGYVSGSGSSTGTMNFNGAIGVPVIKGVAAIRVAGIYSESELNRVRTIDHDLDARDPFARNKGVRVSGIIQPTDYLKFEGVYQRIDNSSRVFDQYASFSLLDPTSPASPLLIKPSDRLSIQESPRLISQKFDVFNWRGELRLAGQKLIYQGQNYKIKLNSRTNTDYGNLFNKRDFYQTVDTRSSATSHEVRLQNEERVAGMFDYVVGFFTQKQNSPTNLTQETPIALPPALGGSVVTVVQTPIVTLGKADETSFFGNATLHLGASTEISGGLRHIQFKTPAQTLLIGGSPLTGGPAVNDKSWIYTASIKHNFSPSLMVYAATGTSRRAPTTIIGNFSPVQSDLEKSFTYLPPEKSESYELGLKSSWLDGRLHLNVTGYHQKFTNYPYKITAPVNYLSFTFVQGTGLIPTVANGAQFAAAVPVEVNGVEGEIAWRASRNLNFSLTAAYSNGKIKNGTIPCNDLNKDGVPDTSTAAPTVAQLQAAYGANFIGACRVSQRSSSQSPFSATAFAEFSQPLSEKADFFARGLFSFNGNSLGDPANRFDSFGSYGILNLFAGLRDPKGAWELNFFAKNVFNTARATSFGLPVQTSYVELQPPTFQTTASKAVTSPYSVVTTTPPREFGVAVRYAFGSR